MNITPVFDAGNPAYKALEVRRLVGRTAAITVTSPIYTIGEWTRGGYAFANRDDVANGYGIHAACLREAIDYMSYSHSRAVGGIIARVCPVPPYVQGESGWRADGAVITEITAYMGTRRLYDSLRQWARHNGIAVHPAIRWPRGADFALVCPAGYAGHKEDGTAMIRFTAAGDPVWAVALLRAVCRADVRANSLRKWANIMLRACADMPALTADLLITLSHRITLAYLDLSRRTLPMMPPLWYIERIENCDLSGSILPEIVNLTLVNCDLSGAQLTNVNNVTLIGCDLTGTRIFGTSGLTMINCKRG